MRVPACRTRRSTAGAAVAVVIALLVQAPAAGADDVSITDTLSVAADGASASTVAVQLSAATFPAGADRVLIGREDVFADSLASGVLQADSPLLLVPPAGPVPPPVLAELERLSPEQVVLLGGPAALAPAVEEQLAATYGVQRRAGRTRIETAVDIAGSDAAGADTVLLARAFADEPDADPTRAFADALAAGALAARTGWPVLLTQSEALTAATRDYLAAAPVRRVVLVGGVAALGAEVENEVATLAPEVQRVAGANRFETAVALAATGGAPSAAAVARVLLVEGQAPDAWAGGFAAAAHASRFGAPVVLANGADLPAATAAWLAPEPGLAIVPDDPAAFPVLTCVASATACEQARQALGLPAAARIVIDPPGGARVQEGDTVRLSVTEQTVPALQAGGSCLPEERTVSVDDGAAGILLASALPEPDCTLTLRVDLPNGAVQTQSVSYRTGAAALQLVSRAAGGGEAGGSSGAVDRDGATVVFRSAGPVVAGVNDTLQHVYVRSADGSYALADARPGGAPAAGDADTSAGGPDVSADGRVVSFLSADPGLTDRPGIADGLTGYARDLGTGATTIVTVDESGAPVAGAVGVRLSGDGGVAVYRAAVDGGFGVFHHQLATGAVGRVRTTTGQPFADGNATGVPAISADGRWIAFSTNLGLAPDDSNEATDAYVYDRVDGVVERVSVGSDGQQADSVTFTDAGWIDISADGALVVFSADAPNLAAGDTAAPRGHDVFVRDRTTGTTTLLSRSPDGGAANDARAGSLSPDGRWAAFASPVLGPGCGVYRYDLVGDLLERVDVGTAGRVEDACPLRTDVSDGGVVVFDTATSYVAEDSGMAGADGTDVYRSGSG